MSWQNVFPLTFHPIIASPPPIIYFTAVGGKKQGLLWINVNMEFNLVDIIQLIVYQLTVIYSKDLEHLHRANQYIEESKTAEKWDPGAFTANPKLWSIKKYSGAEFKVIED